MRPDHSGACRCRNKNNALRTKSSTDQSWAVVYKFLSNPISSNDSLGINEVCPGCIKSTTATSRNGLSNGAWRSIQPQCIYKASISRLAVCEKEGQLPQFSRNGDYEPGVGFSG